MLEDCPGGVPLTSVWDLAIDGMPGGSTSTIVSDENPGDSFLAFVVPSG